MFTSAPDAANPQMDRRSVIRYYQDCDFKIVDQVVALAEKKGVTPAKVALAWMLHKPEVSAPIIGTKLFRIILRECATVLVASYLLLFNCYAP